MLSNQQIQNNWPKIKTQVLNKWNKLSESEVEKTHGNTKSLNQLVSKTYGEIKDFDKTYEKMCESCIPSSKRITSTNDIENRPATAPSAEAGLTDRGTMNTQDDTFHAGSPERRANHNFAKVENVNTFNREFEDEIPSYSSAHSRTSIDDTESDENYRKLDNQDSNTHFSTPDEFYPSQDPTPSREDITLGRNTSSATNKSTAKAAPISSEVSFNDAKKKI